MKISLENIDSDQYMVHQHFVGDHSVALIQPVHIGAVWSAETKIFRSSVWDMNGNPVSLSFKKFWNWGEKPDLAPIPPSLHGAELLEKLDGSTLLFSRYKGHTVIRTRGTVDARKQENGYEIDYLIQKYPKFMAYLESFQDTEYTYACEWLSPTNRIVIAYGDEPDMVLTGAMKHEDYSYATQTFLDEFAAQYELKRPKRYAYDSIDEMKAAVEDFTGLEGLCIYYREGQEILKVKSAEYLAKHRMKSELSNIEKVIDLWFIAGRMHYQEFFDYCSKTFDHEIATDARGFISTICDGWKEVLMIEKSMREKALELDGLHRKAQAEIVLQKWGQTNRASFVFRILDGKEWTDDIYKKLLYQVIKVK